MKKTSFERGQVNRIRLHVLPTDQFKTYAISAYIGAQLTDESVTSTALIPFVLRRGTQSFPETKQFREHLDDLYGAGFGFDIYKRGDYQMVQFRMDLIQDQFVAESESLLTQALQFLGEVLTQPALENNQFIDKYVEAEKRTVQKRIEAIINDKVRYAAERCIEEMCKNEPYRLHPLGKIEDLTFLDSQLLFQQYKQWLMQAPIDLYIVGNATLDEVMPIVKAAFRLPASAEIINYQMIPVPKDVVTVQTIIEKLDVKQGKLNMGLRTNITYAHELYAASLMYNGVLGAYPHAKLFTNVREKASLAYYASSRLDGHKGILTIQSGIEMENYDKALRIIQDQLHAMVEGAISPLELSQTRAMIANQLREMQDAAFELISFDFNSILSGVERTVPALLESIEQVDLQAIQQVAQKVQLDTIYFLRD